MIRVMHVVHSLHEGGIERLLLEICKKIDKNKFEIQICCVAELGSLTEEFKKNNNKIHFLNAKRDFSLINIFINIKKIIELARLLRKEKIIITHGHEFFPTVFSRISSIMAGIKYRYITLHNLYYWWDWKVHIFQRVLSYFTTSVVCNSYSTMNYSLLNDKIDKNKYTVIMNSIDCNYYLPSNEPYLKFLREYNISTEKYVCMNVGNISFRKDQETLIKSIAEVKLEYPNILCFLIGGIHHTEQEYYSKIIDLIKSLNLEDTVFVTGKRKDVNLLLNCCDLYIMPSVAEGFGLALTEAMAIERVCIASDIPPFKEIVDNGIDGFLFESGNIISLVNMMKKVIEMKNEKVEVIKKNARQKVLSKFNSINMVKKYEELYINNLV